MNGEKYENTQEKLDKVKEILASHGIEMNVHGCGCCGSPSVKFIYNGLEIIDEYDAGFKMVEW